MLFYVNQPPNVDGTLSLKWNKEFANNLNKHIARAQREVDTVIGSGEIKQVTPYARYLYYGKVYGPNFPIVREKDGTEHIVFGRYSGDGIIIGWRSPKGKKKHPTGRDIQYSKDKHPLAGKMWFERMKADRKGDILQAAARRLGSNAK